MSPLPSVILSQYTIPFLVSCPLVAYAGGTTIKKGEEIRIDIEDQSGKIGNQLHENNEYTLSIETPRKESL